MIWLTKRLGDVCDITIGGTPRREISKYWDGGDLPWVSIADLSRNGREIKETKEQITAAGARESNAKLLRKGTLLFSFKLSIGKVAFAGTDLYTNEAIAGLPIKAQNELDKEYLFYFLQQLDFSSAQKAVKGATLNKAKMQNLEIPIPPIMEQKKIVAKIEKQFAKIDEAARLRAESEDLASQLLPAALHETFFRLKDMYEPSELGAVARLVRGPFGGSLKKEIFVSTGYAVYEQGNVIDHKLNEFRYFIKASKFEEMGRFSVAPGDILMSCSGTIGRFVIIPTDFVQGVINQALLKITPGTSLLPEYLKLTLQDYIAESTGYIMGSAIKNIVAVSELKQIRIPLPPLVEQKAIVKKFDALAEKAQKLRELQAAQANDLKSLKQSVLHKVFSH